MDIISLRVQESRDSLGTVYKMQNGGGASVVIDGDIDAATIDSHLKVLNCIFIFHYCINEISKHPIRLIRSIFVVQKFRLNYASNNRIKIILLKKCD
jgi:hypothetical protein